MQFNYLPLEIQSQVFSYMTQKELVKYVVPVCRSWYKMAYDPFFWQSLKFNGCIHSLELASRLLNLSVYVSSLTACCFEDNLDWVLSLPKRETLRELYLDDCKINSTQMSKLIENFPLVEKLSFAFVEFLDENVLSQINRWKKLKDIHIDLGSVNETDSYKCIGLIAENFDQLMVISLENYIDVLDSFPFLNLGKLKGEQLSKFSLTSCDIYDASFKSLGELFFNLTDLHFSNCMFSGNAFMALKHLKKLQVLEMSQCIGLFPNDYVYFFREATFYNLIELTINMCLLNDDAMELLPKCFPSLKKFVLDNCDQVTEKGLNSAVSELTNLNYLLLYNLSYVTGRCLLRFPINLTNLKIINCANITKTTVNELLLQRSDVKIIHNKGRLSLMKSTLIYQAVGLTFGPGLK